MLMSKMTWIVLSSALSFFLFSVSPGAAQLTSGRKAESLHNKCQPLSNSLKNGVLFGTLRFHKKGRNNLGINARSRIRIQFFSMPRMEKEKERPICVTAFASRPIASRKGARIFVAPVDLTRLWAVQRVEWQPRNKKGKIFPELRRKRFKWYLFDVSVPQYSMNKLSDDFIYYGSLILKLDKNNNANFIHWKLSEKYTRWPNYKTGKYESKMERFAGPPVISSIFEYALAANEGRSILGTDLKPFLPRSIQKSFRSNQNNYFELFQEALEGLQRSKSDRDALAAAWSYYHKGSKIAKNMPEEALAQYQSAIAKFPAFLEANSALVQLLRKLGKDDMLRASLTRWVDNARDWEPQAFAELVKFLIKKNEIKMAEEIISRYPYANVLWAAANAVQRRRDYEWEIELRSKAAERNTEDKTLHRVLYLTEENIDRGLESFDLRWLNYLKDIQSRGNTQNWAVQPYSYYKKTHRSLRLQ